MTINPVRYGVSMTFNVNLEDWFEYYLQTKFTVNKLWNTSLFFVE
jgi:hypothetical protein